MYSTQQGKNSQTTPDQITQKQFGQKQHTLYIMGNAYRVPAGYTIMACMEYAGFQLTRGCGCRGAVCGACAVLYRVGNSPTWQVGLACQTLTQDAMTFLFLPYHEGQQKQYCAQETTCTLANIQVLHPRLAHCNACNTCTKSCPMGIKVLGYIQALRQENFEKMRKISQECILCGLCAVRCPQNVAPMNVALTARRLYTQEKYNPTAAFAKAIDHAQQGAWQEDITRYKNMSHKELRQIYAHFQASKGGGING